jgi:hypothetical protein
MPHKRILLNFLYNLPVIVLFYFTDVAAQQNGTTSRAYASCKSKKDYVNGTAHLTLCLQGRKVWKERHNNARTTQVYATISNTGDSQVCDLRVEIDDMEKALRWWPTWFNTTVYPYFAFSPEQTVSVGAIIPKRKGFPEIRIREMRPCDDESPPLNDEDAALVSQTTPTTTVNMGPGTATPSSNTTASVSGLIVSLAPPLSASDLPPAMDLPPAPLSPLIPPQPVAPAPPPSVPEKDAVYMQPPKYSRVNGTSRNLVEAASIAADQPAGSQEVSPLPSSPMEAPGATEAEDAKPTNETAAPSTSTSDVNPADTSAGAGEEDEEGDEEVPSNLKGKKKCEVQTSSQGHRVRWCVDLSPKVWRERKRKRRYVRVVGEIANLERDVSICNIQLWLEANKSAVSTWPEWWPNSKDEALDPGNTYVVGANVRRKKGFPKIKLVSFDECRDLGALPDGAASTDEIRFESVEDEANRDSEDKPTERSPGQDGEGEHLEQQQWSGGTGASTGASDDYAAGHNDNGNEWNNNTSDGHDSYQGNSGGNDGGGGDNAAGNGGNGNQGDNNNGGGN